MTVLTVDQLSEIYIDYRGMLGLDPLEEIIRVNPILGKIAEGSLRNPTAVKAYLADQIEPAKRPELLGKLQEYDEVIHALYLSASEQ